MKKLCMILSLALILCFMVGCQDKEARAELEAMKAQAAVEEQNKEVVRKMLAEIDNENLDGVMETLSPNLQWYFPSHSPSPLSKEGAQELLTMFLKSFPKWEHKIEELIAVGNKVITRQVDITTQTEEFQGIPPSGDKIEFGVIIIWTLEDGKIVEMREEGDMLGFYQQLGMELKPKEGE
ncbi:ester cyclase [Acidobacteriota bacterium]